MKGNTKHLLHTTINRRQRNGWTTEIQQCHRFVSRQLEESTQLQMFPKLFKIYINPIEMSTPTSHDKLIISIP